MNASPTTEAPELSRRAVVAGAAWAVPVIVTVTAAPAFAAASNTPTVTATTPNMQGPAAGTVTVTATVRDASGNALSGQAVSFTGPTGVSFSPANPTTNGSGIATSTMTTTDAWALPGSNITITALSGGASGTATITQLGANAYGAGKNYQSSTGNTPSPTQLSLEFPSPIQTLSGADGLAFALLEDGTVWAIGDNSSGQLGDGTTTSRSSWAQIQGLANVIQIAASEAGGYALVNDGTIRAWGSRRYARLGDGSNGTDYSTPVTVQNITNADTLASGAWTGYARLSDGTIRSWGSDENGALGDGASSTRPADPNSFFGSGSSGAPVTVRGIDHAALLAAGSQSGYAILTDNTIKAWGDNSLGQLGDGTTTSSDTPVTVQGISDAVDIAAGYQHAYALLSDGTIKAWGFNSTGELGNGTNGINTNSSTPVSVQGITTADRVAAGTWSGYAFLQDGTVKVWGENGSSELGDGTTTFRNTPVTITGTSDVTALASSSCVGRNNFLIVGARTVTFRPSPAQLSAWMNSGLLVNVKTPSGSPLPNQTVTFTTTAGTVSPSTATTDNQGEASVTFTAGDRWTRPGTVITTTANSAGATATQSTTVAGANAYAVGSNDTGQIGSYGGAGTDSTSPTLVEPTQLSLLFPSPIAGLFSGNGFSLALLKDGTLWSVGNNNQGQLGDGTNTTRSRWTRISALSDVVHVAAAGNIVSAVKSDGSVWQWGQSLQGRGSGDTNTPQQVVGISTATQVAIVPDGGIDSSAYALLNDGTVVSWGGGALGDGTTAYRTTPGPVSGVSNAIQIAAGFGTAFALLSSGTIKSWGVNSAGANLGNGTNDDPYTESSVASPVTVSGITTATQIAAAGYSTYAILANGQVRAWGGNDAGQLGDGTTTTRNTPVAVSGITNATRLGTAVDSAYALLSDGTALAWGANDQGQLGDGTTTGRSTPAAFPGTAPAGAPQITGFSVNSTWKRAFAILA